MSAERLYTPLMLSAAVELADYPPIENAPLHGSAKSPTCGSTLNIDVVLDDIGKIQRVGMKVRACAVGQASAAIMARHAEGKTLGDIATAYDRMNAWLDDEGPAPDWPDVALIAPAKDYRGRHAAILLPWKAALQALSTGPSAS